ncbi:cytochrome b [Striga asiatica]|uniref:Cytochrome b n=1 Tax=Striga asiatica TaxID=4170 RepID=A0A5A7PH60_STRAF|nr:cytochrome b [Striga asiatica]
MSCCQKYYQGQTDLKPLSDATMMAFVALIMISKKIKTNRASVATVYVTTLSFLPLVNLLTKIEIYNMVECGMTTVVGFLISMAGAQPNMHPMVLVGVGWGLKMFKDIFYYLHEEIGFALQQ